MSFSIKDIFRKPKKFHQAGNTAVYTTRYVMKEGSLITTVSHELDGDWQFLGDEPIQDNFSEIGMMVALDEIIKKDKSVLALADLKIGYQATRQTKKDKWTIEKINYSDSEIKEMGYYCSDCGKYHREIPMSYGAKTPETYSKLTDMEKEKAELTRDVCVIGEARFFIKGQIKIKVENKEDFFWNVWAEISKEDFVTEQEVWDDENRFLKKPYSGTLDTQLNCYPNTLGLKVRIQTQKVGLIPDITIDETNHPLFWEQENGIKMDRVIMFAKKIVYGHD